MAGKGLSETPGYIEMLVVYKLKTKVQPQPLNSCFIKNEIENL